MKGSDKAVVFGVVMAVILAGFYVKVLSPKREKASSLGKDVTELQAQIEEQKQIVSFGEAARADFPKYYGRLVVLGKAVPDQADTASLLVQLNAVANQADVDFRGITLGAASSTGSSSTASTAPTTGTTSTTSTTTTTPAPAGSNPSGSTGTTPASSTTPAPATEESAAGLPLGASIGPAGLPTMPYDLTFSGSYFQVADFLKGVDDLVHQRPDGQVAADGRLLTVDGFSLSEPVGTGPNPELSVTLSVTSFVTPSTEGLTAGAGPGGPAPSSTQPQTQPASQTVSP